MTSLVKPIMAFMCAARGTYWPGTRTWPGWQPRQFSRAPQFCLHPFALRDVAQHTGEKIFVTGLQQEKETSRGNSRPSLVSWQLDVVPGQMALAGGEIALQSGRVHVAQMWGHNRGQGFAQQLRFGEAEHLLGGVELADQALLIEGDNGIGGGIDNVAVFSSLSRRASSTRWRS